MIINQLNGIVFNILDYKDNDVIASILCKEYGFLQVQVKGAKKQTSKSYYIMHQFNRISFDLSKLNHDGLSVYKSGSNIHVLDFTKLSYQGSTALMYISELLYKIKEMKEFDQAFFYDKVVLIIDGIQNNKEVCYLINAFIVEVLSINGIVLQLDQCGTCHARNDIIGFDYLNYGFICKDCYVKLEEIEEEKIIRNKEVLQCLYGLSHWESETSVFPDAINKQVFKLLNNYLQDNLGIYLQSGKYLY